MSVPNVTDVAGPLPGAAPPAPSVPALPPAPAPAGMPQMPGVPAAAPPVPVPAPAGPAPLPTNPVDVSGQLVQQQADLGAESVQNAKDKAVLDTKLADEKAKADAANAVALEQFQHQQELHRQAADAEIQAKRQQYEQQPLTSLYQRQSTGRKVAIALATLVGGIGWDSNHQNRALQELHSAEEEDLNLQKEKHADLFRDLQLSLDNKKELGPQQLHDLADFQALQAAKWSSQAGKLNSMIAANRGTADVTAAKQAALELTDKANKAHEASITAQATANHLNAMSAHQQQLANRGHGTGTGGGSTALADFAAKAGELKPGEPITPELVNLGLRAHLKPNQIGTEADKYRNSAAKSDKLATAVTNTAGNRLLSKETDAWRKQNNIDAITKKQQELASVVDELNNAPHNPLQQALAVEKAVSSARGGAASKQALALALHHLGGKWDSIEAVVQGARNGELGPAQMDNFISFIKNEYGTAQKEGKDKYDQFNQYIASQPADKRAALEAERGRIFSGLSGFGGRAAPAQRPPTMVLGGKTLRLQPDGTYL